MVPPKYFHRRLLELCNEEIVSSADNKIAASVNTFCTALFLDNQEAENTPTVAAGLPRPLSSQRG